MSQALPLLLKSDDAASFDTRVGQRRPLVPGRSDTLRHFAIRDHRGVVLLEGVPSRDVPLIGLDFGAVFSRSAPMGVVPFDRSSSQVGRGGADFLARQYGLADEIRILVRRTKQALGRAVRWLR